MTSRRRRSWRLLAQPGRGLAPLLLLAVALSCGVGTDDVEHTVGTVRPVVAEARIDGEPVGRLGRAGAGAAIALDAGGVARLSLDGGAEVLLGADARVTIDDEAQLTIEEGRLFAEADAGETLTVSTGESHFRLHGASASFIAGAAELEVYVVRGELSYTAAGERGIVGAGHTVTVGDGALRTEATLLFDDWTGGLTESGPVGALPSGIGVLEARVPEEVGQARWPLVVRRMNVQVRIEGDLAITEVDQEFFNPASEALEGFYRIRVPEGAILSRFAVDRNGTLVDGYVRERALARRAYQQQVYRGSTDDPALLEWEGRGRYQARIYPIRPGETRRIVIRYGQWLTPGASGEPRRYVYPMGGSSRAPRISELSLEVDLSQADVTRVRAGLGAEIEENAVRLRRSDYLPRSDFWLELSGGESPSGVTRAYRSPHEAVRRAAHSRDVPDEADERDYWFAPVILPASLAGGPDAGLDVVILADVSAGMDRARLELSRSSIESLLGLLREQDRVAVAGVDMALRDLGDTRPALGPVGEARTEALLDWLARVPPGGATDLGETIARAAELLDPERPHAIVYVGDGHATVGEHTAATLLERFGRATVPLRFYAIGVGADADVELLSALSGQGGRAFHVEERREGAEAALDLLSHARSPIAHGVTVELGEGIANAYPRGAVDAVLGQMLPLAGRVAGQPPSTILVRGEIRGEPFEHTVALNTLDSTASEDLRLRWANERLAQLLRAEAAREEVAELGVRYGLITPFTSYYVPSARELGLLGASALPLIDRSTLLAEAPSRSSRWVRELPLGLVLSIAGCGGEAAPPGEDVIGDRQAQLIAPPEPSPAMEGDGDDGSYDPTLTPPAVSPATQPAPPPMAGQGATAAPATAFDPEPEPEAAEEAMPVAPVMDVPQPAAPRRRPRASEARGDADRGASALQGAVQACFRRATGAGRLSVRYTVDPLGRVTGAALTSSSGDASVDACVLAVVRSTTFGATGQAYSQSVSFSFGAGGGGPPLSLLAQLGPIALQAAAESAQADAHSRRACSDAASLPLADRVPLWRERLAQGHWWSVRQQALRDCEAPTWRARRALLTTILSAAGSIEARIQIVRQLQSSAERELAHTFVMRSVRSAEDLRAIRAAFGDAIDWALIDQILERARTPERRVRELRRLIAQYPDSFELELRLLELLEAEGRTAELNRLARRMRRDPLADAGVRTAIGELLFRQGDTAEAFRAFSEIVELAPLDELARRRVGDLFRAHGFYREAYRQYETLRELRPDDPEVLLLLAQAAAGIGRIDEALRLEARVRQTGQPGSARGLARTALLLSSVRLAHLRSDAEGAEREAELRRRLRRSGVLSQAVDLRVALTFTHPDAQLSLRCAHPGQALGRPGDLAPEHGIEVCDFEEQGPGAHRFSVSRGEHDRAGHEAWITVIFREGEDDERIEVIELDRSADAQEQSFVIEGQTLTERRRSAR